VAAARPSTQVAAVAASVVVVARSMGAAVGVVVEVAVVVAIGSGSFPNPTRLYFVSSPELDRQQLGSSHRRFAPDSHRFSKCAPAFLFSGFSSKSSELRPALFSFDQN
jgi:hypothetical protein